MPSHASLHAPGDPGKENIKVPLATQAMALDLIDDDDTILERDPLEKASALGELMAFKHEGFWRCMDTKRDRDSLQKLWERGELP